MKTKEEILSLLTSGLTLASEKHTQEALGDRSTYLGLSDLALGLLCPRAVGAAKLASTQPKPTLERLLKLRRGHWVEHGIEEALRAAGRKHISQLQISLRYENVPIQAHLDLVLPAADGRSLTVLELKSVSLLREQIFANHEAQLYGQITLLRDLWSRPVFSAGDYTESFSFPELVKRRLGILFPNSVNSVSIRGFVLTIAPQAAKPFGPYEPNSSVLDALLRTAIQLWKHITSIRAGKSALDDLPWLAGFNLCCDWCDHNRGCPKFHGDCHPELETELTALTELKATRNNLDAEIKEREDQLKALASLMNLPGQWINAGKHRFRVSSQAGKVTLDQNLLKIGLSQAGGLDEAGLEALMVASQKTGRPFERLQISPIN
jgi:hypothetical protein